MLTHVGRLACLPFFFFQVSIPKKKQIILLLLVLNLVSRPKQNIEGQRTYL